MSITTSNRSNTLLVFGQNLKTIGYNKKQVLDRLLDLNESFDIPLSTKEIMDTIMITLFGN